MNKKNRGLMPAPPKMNATSPGGSGALPTPGRMNPGPRSQGVQTSSDSDGGFRNGNGVSISREALPWRPSKLERGLGDSGNGKPGPMRNPFPDSPAGAPKDRLQQIGEGTGKNPGPKSNTNSL